jgi:hypothetical protein
MTYFIRRSLQTVHLENPYKSIIHSTPLCSQVHDPFDIKSKERNERGTRVDMGITIYEARFYNYIYY